MIPLNSNFAKIDSSLIGHTLILTGPCQSGKTSLVYWALRNDDDFTIIVTVDCSIYRTEMQFIQKMTKDLGNRLGVADIDKRIIVN
jgi:Ni2+-binding GTPase involved in maturation of urease and hydrogenase